MEQIVRLVKGAPHTGQSNDDDLSDRLSSRYTVAILVVFAILVMAKHVGKPMTCWTPVHFKKGHSKFATNYCWIKNTFYLPWDEEIPAQGNATGRKMITYYQWIPFILIGQAILFYLPSLIWHGLNSRAGVDADNLLSASHSFAKTEMVETRDRTLQMVTNQMDRFLASRGSNERDKSEQAENQRGKNQRDENQRVPCCGRPLRKRLGCYLVMLYLLSKACYVGNAIGQLFLLNVVLSTTYSTLGFDVIRQNIDQTTISEVAYVAFPRVTLCEFEIRGQDMMNVHSYTLQCVLPVNLFNEAIYIFLWFWIVFVAIVSSGNLLIWFLRVVIKPDRSRFVANHLKLGHVKYTEDQLKEFMDKYLRQDGCLLLRLIAHNSDNITTTEITCSLFHHHCAKKDHHQSALNNGPSSFHLLNNDET